VAIQVIACPKWIASHSLTIGTLCRRRREGISSFRQPGLKRQRTDLLSALYTMNKPNRTTRFGTRAIRSRRSGLPLVIGVIAGVLSFSACSGTPAQNQSVQVTAHTAILSWSPSTSVVVGYRVYRSTQSGMAYTLITPTPVSGTSFTDSTVVKGQTYFWVVTSVDAQFVESGFSNEVFATIPSS
jgi:hypothetical protein